MRGGPDGRNHVGLTNPNGAPAPCSSSRRRGSLEAHTLACCIKAPKRYSFFLTSRIMELASEVHDHVRAANNIWPTNQHEAQLRRDELLRANIALQNLNPKLQLLYDAILQNPENCAWIHRAMEKWGNLINEEAKLIAAVKKNDRQRYKDLPER